MGKIELTNEHKEALELLAQTGFAYADLLKSMPDELSILYKDYCGNRGYRNMVAFHAKNFSSLTLAITKGYTPEERRKYIKEKTGREPFDLKFKQKAVAKC